MREVHVGLLGCGVVGSALVNLIHDEERDIAEAAGVRLKLCKTLVRDPSKTRNGLAKRLSFTCELDEVLHYDHLDIVVELLGGVDTALTAIRKGLRAGKSVVTANKVILSRHGEELTELAHDRGCSLAYEASVGSCIPILQSLDHTLASETFHAVTGILNGTTNFILSKMARDGLTYADALKLAQKCGLAETDPSADVSGSDAACKLVILARKAFNASLHPSEVLTEGITLVSDEDLRFASRFGYTIKLLAVAKRRGDELELHVGPQLVPISHALASINDESNAVLLVGESVGRLFFAGPGAGPAPTARAVLGDILSIATGEKASVPGRRALGITKPNLAAPASFLSRFYVRVTFEDQPHVLAGVTRILDACDVEVHRVEALGQGRGDIVFLTHPSLRGNVQRALARLRRTGLLSEEPRAFSIYEDCGSEDPRSQTSKEASA